MEIEKDGKYFRNKYSEINNQLDMDICHEEILHTIRLYNESIFAILNEEDISQDVTQKKIIHYQNKKTEAMVIYNEARRQEEIYWYERKIFQASTLVEINELREKLEQQKIDAQEDCLFLTDQEKENLFEQMNEKAETIDRNKSSSWMRKKKIFSKKIDEIITKNKHEIISKNRLAS